MGDWNETWRGRWLAGMVTMSWDDGWRGKGVGVFPGGAGGLAEVWRAALEPAYRRGFQAGWGT